MASTRTITATDPATGRTFSRRTARTYVAVVITGADGEAWPHTWAGRPDLAAKALARYRKADPTARLAPVTADPWAAAAPEPVAAPDADLGRSLSLAAGGRLATRAVPAAPWDPGTAEARATVAAQQDRVGMLWPIRQAMAGAGLPIPPAWATDGPVMAGEWPPEWALGALPLGHVGAAADALAALPPVTRDQDAALAACRAHLARV